MKYEVGELVEITYEGPDTNYMIGTFGILLCGMNDDMREIWKVYCQYDSKVRLIFTFNFKKVNLHNG